MQLLTMMPNGKRVPYDPHNTHLAPHLVTDPQLLGLVRDFLHKTNFDELVVQYEYDAGRIVGLTDEIDADDPGTIFYAKRRGYETYTPPYPDEPPAPPESRTYWATHTLAFGSQPVDEASITTTCPW